MSRLSNIIQQYKRDELSSHEKTWKNLACMLLSERGQSGKAACDVLPSIWHSGKGKTLEAVERSMVARNFREGREA